MKLNHDQLLQAQNIAAHCADTRDVCQKAAEKTANEDLRSFFSALSDERNNFLVGFEILLKDQGQTLENIVGTGVGMLQKLWVAMKEPFNEQRERRLLKETLRSERIIEESIEELQSLGEMPKELENIVDKLQESNAQAKLQLVLFANEKPGGTRF
ncbi:DUF2383 domain-containing protein [Halocola ammonii]